MGISSVFTHVGDVQYMETRALQGLVQVLVDQACLYICPIIFQSKEFFHLQVNTTKIEKHVAEPQIMK